MTKKQPQKPFTESQKRAIEEIAAIIADTYKPLRRRVNRIHKDMNAEVRPLEMELAETKAKYQALLDPIQEQVDEQRRRIVEILGKHWGRQSTVVVGNKKVVRQNFVEMTVHQPEVLLSALDAIGKTHLVTYEFTISPIAKLLREGKLGDIGPDVVEYRDVYGLQIRRLKKDETRKS